MQRLNVIIPARGGSKGVPKKNIKLLNNLPLIAYPIKAALKCKYVSNIYVSTDNDEIATIANSYGASIITRPNELATDSALDIDVMRHAVEFLQDTSSIVHTPYDKAYQQVMDYYDEWGYEPTLKYLRVLNSSGDIPLLTRVKLQDIITDRYLAPSPRALQRKFNKQIA